MPKQNKIDRFGLGNEVLSLREKGLNLEEIANQLKYNHPSISELKDVNQMTISRYLKRHSIQSLKDDINQGLDPETQLREELRRKIDDWEDETHEIYLIMKKALKRIVKEGDDYKTIKAAQNTLKAIEQSRKNLITQVEEGFKRFGMIEQAKEVNFVQVNNLLVGVSEILCPTCRRKLVDYIMKMEDTYE